MKASLSTIFIYIITITIINLAWLSLSTVKGDGVAVTEVFVPIRVCHKAIYLTGVELDDDRTYEIINSLTSLDQPFELHPNDRGYFQARPFDELNLMVRLTCLAYIVLVQDGPFLRERKMNLLLKGFNRKRGNENDFVLVFAPVEDGISGWSDWRTGSVRSLWVRGFPDNVLLIETVERPLDEFAQRRYCISDVYTFQLYCDEEEEVCWRAESTELFPTRKYEFDAEFLRARAHWRYNYNEWPILLVDPLLLQGSFDGVANMSFRSVSWGGYTWDDYIAGDDYYFHAPTVWLIQEIARHLNATLLSRSSPWVVAQRTEIQPRLVLNIDKKLEFSPQARNVHLQYSHIFFVYCTNGTELRDPASMLAIFKPFEFIFWILLVLVMICTALLSWFAGRGFQIDQVIGCLGCQGMDVDSKHRLAMIFVLWQVVALLINNFYGAFIESILAAPDLLPRIQDFKELNQSCEVPWVQNEYRDVYKDRARRVRGMKHLKALMDRSRGIPSLVNPDFVRYMVEHEKQCIIHATHLDASWWAEIAQQLEPGVTCTEGNEKLIGDPLMWIVSPPNAAIGYRTVRALQVTGILMKFGEYYETRWKQLKHHKVVDLLKKKTRAFEWKFRNWPSVARTACLCRIAKYKRCLKTT